MFLTGSDALLRKYKISSEGVGRRDGPIVVDETYFFTELSKIYSKKFGTEKQGKFEEFLKDTYRGVRVPRCFFKDLQNNVKEKILGIIPEYSIFEYEGQPCIKVLVNQ